MRAISIFLLVVSFICAPPISRVFAENPEYSCTWIEHFDTANNLPDCEDDTNSVVAWLSSRGYDRRFVWSEDFVWKIDFDTNNSGYEGLDEADFHIHSGHGGVGYILLADGSHVVASDVRDHWDWDSEWVFLYDCLTLREHASWAAALNTGTHALFGFTEVCNGTSGALPDAIMRRAIDWGWTPVQAYYSATRDVSSRPGNTTAIFITDTYDQWYNDHLWYNDPGNSTAADEYSDDHTYWYATWSTH